MLAKSRPGGVQDEFADQVAGNDLDHEASSQHEAEDQQDDGQQAQPDRESQTALPARGSGERHH